MTALTPDPMPIWKKLTEQGELEEQYQAIRSKPTANDKGTAFALARFAEARIYVKAEQHIAAQAATIEQLEEDAHIAETKFQQQGMILEQQAAEIKRLRTELAAAQQWVPNTNYASGSITFPLSENMVRDAIEDDIWDESLGGQGGDDATDA